MAIDLVWTANGWSRQSTTQPDSTLLHTKPGVLAVAAGSTSFRVPFNISISGVQLSIGTAPVGADLLVDVNKNGTTIFTDQSKRPTILNGATTSLEATAMDVRLLGAGDSIRVDVDQVGGATPGSDLTVFIRYQRV